MPYHIRPSRTVRRTTRSTPSPQRSVPSPQRSAIQGAPSPQLRTTSPQLSTMQSVPHPQPRVAPAGYHYMPDGSLMSDIEHARLHSATAELKEITNFNLDLHNIPEAGETRRFKVTGEKDAIFSLEIKRGTDFYNFQTNLFQATKTRLSNIKLSYNGFYSGTVVFPKVTVGAQFDIYLWAEDVYGSKHANYNEVRFPDGSMDINSSTGSNSNLMQKVLYQTLDTSTILSHYSPTGAISISNTNQTIKTTRGKKYPAYTAFEISTLVGSGGLSIDRQPTPDDLLAFVTRTIGDPQNMDGENVFPSISDTDTVDGAIVGGGSVIKVVMDNLVASNLVVGDKITAPVSTDTVDGAVSSGIKVVMDNNVAGKMAIGDQITGNDLLDVKIVTVAALNPDGDNTKEFSMSQNIGLIDGVTLSFSNRRNHRWGIDNIDGLKSGMRVVPGVFFASTPTIKDFTQTTTNYEGELAEKIIVTNKTPALDTLGVKPVFTRNGTTKVKTVVQSGNIIFSQQALLSLSAEDVRIYGYGLDEINRVSGYDLDFTDLRAELNTVTTTTTAAVSNSTTIPVTSKLGIIAPTTQTVDGAITNSRTVVLDSVTGLNVDQSLYAVSAGTLTGTPTITAIDENNKTITLSSVQTFADGITLTFPNSIISGIGIDSTAINPYVASISSLNLTASAAQTLEDAQTFTFTGAGDILTIKGNIKINEVGNEDVTLRFDVEKFLTKHTN